MKRIVIFAFTLFWGVAKANNFTKGWYGFGIGPMKNGTYFYTNSNLTVKTNLFNGSPIVFDKKNVFVSFPKRDWKGIFTFPARKFSSLFYAKDLSTIELNEGGFFLNGRLVCEYDPVYRNSDPLLDIRIFNKACAHKYNLVSYTDFTGVKIGLFVNKTADEKVYYELNGKKFYLKDTGLDYAIENIRDIKSVDIDIKDKIVKNLKFDSYLDKIKACVVKKDYKCLSSNFFMHNEVSPIRYKYPGLHDLLTSNKHVKLTHSPYILKRLKECGARSIPENTFTDEKVLEYFSYVMINCFKDHLLNCLNADNISQYYKSETNFMITKSNTSVTVKEGHFSCKFGKSPILVDGFKANQKVDDDWYIYSINFYSSKTDGVLHARSENAICKKPYYKKECDFWEKLFSKRSFNFPSEKNENLPKLGKKEFEELVKDKR